MRHAKQTAFAAMPLPTTITAFTTPTTSTILLPIIQKSEQFTQNKPIWANDSVPSPQTHRVALFRYRFTLLTPITATRLALFADTRYQVWLDGTWLGRGPARFSRHTHEYDTYELAHMDEGNHLVAVLVQWAPNVRRSESTRPSLQAQLSGVMPTGKTIYHRSDTLWKVLLSDAWEPNAAPVHSWQLIGPTELLDTRALPIDWMQPTFDDSTWHDAVVVPLSSQAHYQPRSIPYMAEVPMPTTLFDAGQLNPNAHLFEMPFTENTCHFTCTATVSGTLLLKTLALSATLLQQGYSWLQLPLRHRLSIQVDDVQQSFQSSGTVSSHEYVLSSHDDDVMSPYDMFYEPPATLTATSKTTSRIDDILSLTLPISAGIHHITITNTLAPVWSLVLSNTCVLPPRPMQQTNHVGRRLLLSDMASDTSVISFTHRIATTHAITIQHTPAYVLFDMGRVVHGRLYATVTGAAGTIVDIGWDERLFDERKPLPYPGLLHPQWNQTDSWILDGQARDISTIDSRTGRYVLVAVWATEPLITPVTFSNLHIREERYPVMQHGSFHSPSARLNTIWQTGVDTLYPSMTDAYADPWRERGQWWGDAFVADHINQVAFGDTLLLRRGVLLMAEAFDNGKPVALAPNQHGELLFDYGMLWVHSLHNYATLTGDSETVQQVYPTLVAFLAFLARYEHPETHLLDIPAGHWSKTALIDWAGAKSRYGQSTALNALYYATLQQAAACAEMVSRTADATRWQARAAHIKAQALFYLYNAEDGAFVSSIVQGNVVAATPQAQAWALAYRLVPDDDVKRVGHTLMQQLSPTPDAPNVEIYGMYWVLEALGNAQMYDEVLHILEQYYGALLDKGATTWWESFNAHHSYHSALSHVWGGAPTWYLTRFVLGAERTGINSWRITPRAIAPTGTYSGTLPLANGTLALAWHVDNTSPTHQNDTARHVTLVVDVPTGSVGEVVLPYSLRWLSILLNEHVVWHDGVALQEGITTEPDGIVLLLQTGHYTLTLVQAVE